MIHLWTSYYCPTSTKLSGIFGLWSKEAQLDNYGAKWDWAYNHRGWSRANKWWKINNILRKIGQNDIGISSIQRLGKECSNVGPQREQPRPIKLALKFSFQRKEILQAARNLHGEAAPLSCIFIKKDTHPDISRKYKRLRDVERRQKEKQGREIKYDHTTHTVNTDDMVIDTFRPTFL